MIKKTERNKKKGNRKKKRYWKNKGFWIEVLKEVPRVYAKGLKLIFRRKIKIIIFIIVINFILIGTLEYKFLKSLPNPELLRTNPPSLTTKIYDRNGVLLYKIFKDENRTYISLAAIPDYVKKSILAIEDDRFYKHIGISIKGIVRAVKQNYVKNNTEGIISGGSTITQQLIKNKLLGPERTWERKIKEAVLALWAERKFSKDEILEMYLNEVGFGGTAYGVEEASRFYFGKSASELNLAEASLIAGLPSAPTSYSPFYNIEKAKFRQQLVLDRMLKLKYISRNEYETALNTPVNLTQIKTELLAPHFVMYVREILEIKYGKELVERGGLDVYTTLDLNIQNMAELEVTKELEKLKLLNVSNSGVLVTNPATGAILAMVGSKNYFAQEGDGYYNITTALRQPGSSIKPIMYALALNKGFTAASIIEDKPVSYPQTDGKFYKPVNYDGKYHGIVTIRQALANSYNIPAVKVLEKIGVVDFIDWGTKMGMTTWEDKSRYGLSITLGGGEIKMVDMAQAYGVLANEGAKVPITPIFKIERPVCGTNGSFEVCDLELINESNKALDVEKVLDRGTAFIINDILADNWARVSSFGSRSNLYIPGHRVSVKTGTTNDIRDNWTIGYNKEFLVAVWVGNNDNTPMARVASGITGASPIWNHVMTKLLTGYIDPPLVVPESVVKTNICNLTGTLTCEGCPTVAEYFVKGTEPTKYCSSEWVKNYLEEKWKKEQEKK